MTSDFKVLYGVDAHFTPYTHSSWEVCVRFMSVFMGVSDHSPKRAFVRSDADVGQNGLPLSPLQFIPKVTYGADVRGLCADQ